MSATLEFLGKTGTTTALALDDTGKTLETLGMILTDDMGRSAKGAIITCDSSSLARYAFGTAPVNSGSVVGHIITENQTIVITDSLNVKKVQFSSGANSVASRIQVTLIF